LKGYGELRRRVLFGGIWHETNSFCPVQTDLDAFHRFALIEGDALLTAYEGTNTEIGGFIAGACQQNFELVPTLFAGAIPSGLVSRAALDHLTNAVVARAQQRDFDGVLFAIHGAMVAETIDEADAYILQRLRDAIGRDIPLVVTFDLHGNITQPLIDAADVLVGYDTLPHVDMAERGREATEILRYLLDGAALPRKAFRKLPMLTVPQMQGTDSEPMRGIMAELHKLEQNTGIMTASVAPGFPYTDVPHLGMAVLAYGDAADTVADRLAKLIWSHREQFRPYLLSPAAAVRRAMAEPCGPVFLTEPADNVGGGAPGDGTTLLAAMVAAGAEGAVVIWDPAAAATAASAGIGRFRGDIGGRTLLLHGPPFAIDGYVTFAGPVAYRRDAAYMTGQPVDLGLVATVAMAGVKVVLTSERAMPFDTLHLRRAGISPEHERIVSLKCGSNWRAAFGDMAAAQYYVDTPGICTSNIERVPLTRLRGEYFPRA
jgi:microcystin degradation protein MlrC